MFGVVCARARETSGGHATPVSDVCCELSSQNMEYQGGARVLVSASAIFRPELFCFVQMRLITISMVSKDDLHEPRLDNRSVTKRANKQIWAIHIIIVKFIYF